jgi:hypothetical protein
MVTAARPVANGGSWHDPTVDAGPFPETARPCAQRRGLARISHTFRRIGAPKHAELKAELEAARPIPPTATGRQGEARADLHCDADTLRTPAFL